MPAQVEHDSKIPDMLEAAQESKALAQRELGRLADENISLKEEVEGYRSRDHTPTASPAGSPVKSKMSPAGIMGGMRGATPPKEGHMTPVTEKWYIEELRKKEESISELTKMSETSTRATARMMEAELASELASIRVKRTVTPMLLIMLIILVVGCFLFREPLSRHSKPLMEKLCRHTLGGGQQPGVMDPWASRPVNAFGL